MSPEGLRELRNAVFILEELLEGLPAACNYLRSRILLRVVARVGPAGHVVKPFFVGQVPLSGEA